MLIFVGDAENLHFWIWVTVWQLLLILGLVATAQFGLVVLSAALIPSLRWPRYA